MARRSSGVIAVVLITLATLTLFSSQVLKTYEVPHVWPAPLSSDPRASQQETLEGVPLNIILTWNTRSVPYYMKKHIEDLQVAHPEFTIYVYSHAESREYIQRCYPAEVVAAYDSLIPGADKSDLFRYCKLYRDGGVYMDIKFVVHKPLMEMIRESSFQAVRDDQREVPGCVCNGFLISPPKNEVFARCIEIIVENCKRRDYSASALHISGPCVLGKVITQVQPTMKFHYQFSWATREVYDQQGAKVLTEYPEYRTEQKRHMKAMDYREAWKERGVYA